MSNRSRPQSRRTFLKSAALTLGAAASVRGLLAADGTAETKAEENLPPVRTITHGRKFHWFAYYDKLQFDPAVRYALSNEVDFEHRSPTAADVIKVGMVDLDGGGRRLRRPGHRSVGLHVALHLARSQSHPGLVASRFRR